MKYVIQLISHQTGYRSEPILNTYTGFAEALKESEVDVKDFVLIVGAHDPDATDSQLELATSPLFTVGTFLKTTYPELTEEIEQKEEAENG